MFRIAKGNGYKIFEAIVFAISYCIAVCLLKPYWSYFREVGSFLHIHLYALFLIMTVIILLISFLLLKFVTLFYKKKRLANLRQLLAEDEKFVLLTEFAPSLTFISCIAPALIISTVFITIRFNLYLTPIIMCVFFLLIILMFGAILKGSLNFLIFTNKRIVCIPIFSKFIFISYAQITKIIDATDFYITFEKGKNLIIYSCSDVKFFDNDDVVIPDNVTELLNKVVDFCKGKKDKVKLK